MRRSIKLLASAPEEGANLWKVSDEASGTTLYLLGTMHGRILAKMSRKKDLVNWLNKTVFDQVYAELEENPEPLDVPALVTAIETLEKSPGKLDKREQIYRDREVQEATRILEGAGSLDTIYTSLAAKGNLILGLETRQLRAEVRSQYASSVPNQSERHYGDTPELLSSAFGLTDANIGVEEDTVQAAREAQLSPEERAYNLRNKRMKAQVEKIVTSGNEKQLMGIHSQHLLEGIDVQDIEGRNRRWLENKTRGQYHPGSTLLWVVGVSHLAGLIVDLRGMGWQAGSYDPGS